MFNSDSGNPYTIKDNIEFDFSFFSFQNQVGLFGHNADHKFLKQEKSYKVPLLRSPDFSKHYKHALNSRTFKPKKFTFGFNFSRVRKDLRYRRDLRIRLGHHWITKTYFVYYTVHDFSLEKNQKEDGFLYLDNVYPDIVPNNWIVLKDQEKYDAYSINEINSISLNDFELNYKVNVLRLDETHNLNKYKLHETTAYIGSKKLILARVTITTPINNSNRLIHLEKKIDGLQENQNISITGELENSSKKGKKSEIGQIVSIRNDSEKYTILELSDIKNNYRRDTVTFNFNV
jgi:hypothetical protein